MSSLTAKFTATAMPGFALLTGQAAVGETASDKGQATTTTTTSTAQTGKQAEDVAALTLEKIEPTQQKMAVEKLKSDIADLRIFPSLTSRVHNDAGQLALQDGLSPADLTFVMQAQEDLRQKLGLQNFQTSMEQGRQLGMAFSGPAVGVPVPAIIASLAPPQFQPAPPKPVMAPGFSAPSPFGRFS